MGEYLICGYCGQQFQSAGHYNGAHEEGYCGLFCQSADELIADAARATEIFGEDMLEQFTKR